MPFALFTGGARWTLRSDERPGSIEMDDQVQQRMQCCNFNQFVEYIWEHQRSHYVKLPSRINILNWSERFDTWRLLFRRRQIEL